MEGNAAALDYLQREAGQTRAGYHPGGRWEDAREWVIASFRQHTSRDGDPQLHVHNLILHKVRRESDGAWRALDSMSLYRHRPAASAIAALAMENALTRRFGVRWVQRQDGHGREIAGVEQALMDMFSSRRQSIGPLTARLAREYEAQFGRAPDARALASLRQWANHATRRGKDTGALDLAALVRRWSAQARASEAGALEPFAPKSHGHAPARHAQPSRRTSAANQQQAHPAPLTDAQAHRLIQEAVAAVQAAQSTWTEADLIRHLGERLPAQVGAMTAPEAAALLPALARQALATEAVMLSAPEWPRVPDCLRRASGESVYIPHGAARYATGAQLALEERLLADAQEQARRAWTPPPRRGCWAQNRRTWRRNSRRQPPPKARHRAHRLRAAPGSGRRRVLGADLRPPRRGAGRPGGLRQDPDRRGDGADLAAGRDGRGDRPGHLADRPQRPRRRRRHPRVQHRPVPRPPARPARGPRRAAGRARVAADPGRGEHDVAGRHGRDPGPRAANDCKVVVTGDHEQLAAVEGGGAMMLLARRLGYVQLAEPQRFTHAWERDATLRLRAGDVTVLADYEEHGRLRGGTPEEATEQAYRGWLADYLAGKDTVLMARTEDQARELSRRARDDLIRYGLVAAGPAIRLAQGEQASAGDLVMARRNTRSIQAGEDGRDLANRDVLQITSTTAGPGGSHAEVRRLPAATRPPASPAGRRRSCPRRYLAAARHPRLRDDPPRRAGPHHRHRPRPGRRAGRPAGPVRRDEPRPRRQLRLLHNALPPRS